MAVGTGFFDIIVISLICMVLQNKWILRIKLDTVYIDSRAKATIKNENELSIEIKNMVKEVSERKPLLECGEYRN